ncbi:MAG TPA: hypothetical protein VEU94_02855, partial [Terriglobales bacterium]|nr:hypothetical protein [Terriglobales bacterium]
PTVSLTPLADQELHGTETLRWSARDPENRPLRFAILFSRDNRNNWQGLNAGITKTEAPLNSDFLPGTDSAWFKIRASNQGTSTESAPIGPYRIRPKPPTISIDAPAEDTTIEAGTPVLVSCTAFSWQDGLITAPRSFAWHVDGRSIPGGSWTVIRNLAAGPHAVRASVHDSAGRNASATLRLLVETDQKYLPAR